MSNSIINTVNSAANGNQRINIISSSEVGALGKNDFLNMILVQLQNQDPLNPMDNSEFATQLAQFSTLEQMTNMSEQLGSLSEISKQIGEILEIVKDNATSSKTESSKNTNQNDISENHKEINEVTLSYNFIQDDLKSISNILNTDNFKKIYSI